MIEVLAFGIMIPRCRPMPPHMREQGHQETIEHYEAYCDALEVDYLKKLDAWEDACAEDSKLALIPAYVMIAGISLIMLTGGVLGIGQILGWWTL